MSLKSTGTLALFLILLVVAALAPTTHAAVIPPLNVTVVADGGNWGGNPTGTGVGGDIYNFTGAHDHTTWGLTWNLNVDPDPFINGNIVVTNNLGVNQLFTLNFLLPVAPIGPTSLIGGSVSGTITTDGTAGTLSNFGTESIYTALIDGLPVATLLNNPIAINAPAFDSGSTGSTNFGAPVPSQLAGPITTSIGIQLKFVLTPGDSASFTSVFVAQPVPEPTTASIIGLGAASLLARRRRVAI